MNGTEAALIDYARRSAENAKRAEDYALQAQQTTSRMERELSEIRREMRLGFEALSAAVTPQRHTILEHEDWEDSPTGTHKMVSKSTWERWERERDMKADAKKWQKALQTSGKIALAIALVVLGWVVRHVMGKP